MELKVAFLGNIFDVNKYSKDDRAYCERISNIEKKN